LAGHSCERLGSTALKPARRDALLAIPFFLGTWAAVWSAGWLVGVYFFAGSDLPAFIGGYLGCLRGPLPVPSPSLLNFQC
jgi:hypothetical protein